MYIYIYIYVYIYNYVYIILKILYIHIHNIIYNTILLYIYDIQSIANMCCFEIWGCTNIRNPTPQKRWTDSYQDDQSSCQGIMFSISQAMFSRIRGNVHS